MTIPMMPLLFIIIGALLWWLARPSKLADAGRIIFAAGVLALALTVAGTTIRF